MTWGGGGECQLRLLSPLCCGVPLMSDFIIIRDERLRAKALERILALDLSKPMKMTLAPYKKNRSLEQNSLYWKWLGIIAKDTGHNADEIHEFCKIKFLPPVFVEINGEVHEARRTTTKLKIDDMSTYMTKVHAWATGELGILLPIPEERHAA